MAFHVACPITCRKICQCINGTPLPLRTPLGQFPFWQDVQDLERLLAKPAVLVAGGSDIVEVLVPRLAADLKSEKSKPSCSQSGEDSEEAKHLSLSKKGFLRKKARAAGESTAMPDQSKRALQATQQLGEGRLSNASGGIICEICLDREVMGSKKSDRMISCSRCGRYYHRFCLKHWAGNRDLFNWSSWVCGSCRVCEVCRHTGEANKLLFCKRCDEAYHSYCQQPPAKQVSKGPFLCPKHTICHGCGSRVPGSGVSSRWFMCFTNCDACGRLFMKGIYCPICLKVYRDSEATPMVCCDNCEHWIHCKCDGISDEKYREFQLDNDLHYLCAVCRGDCSQVKDLEEAIKEIWRRRDAADRDVILQNQAASGILSEAVNMRLCPSDDESNSVEDWLPKKAPKPLPFKGNERDKKPPKKYPEGIKAKKFYLAGGVANKLKRTLSSIHASASNLRTSLVEGVQKKKKKKNESVIKLTKYMIQARESKPISNMNRVGVDETTLCGNITQKDTPLSRNGTGCNKFDRAILGHQDGTLKLVNRGYDKTRTNVLPHVPSRQKGTQNRVKLQIPLAAMTKGSFQKVRADIFHSNEDEPKSHAIKNFQSMYLIKGTSASDGRGENFKHNDHHKIMHSNKEKHDKHYLKGLHTAMRDNANEEMAFNDASSNKQGFSFCLIRKRNIDAHVMGNTSVDDSSFGIRKKMKSSAPESVDTRDALSNLPLKLSLRKPGLEKYINVGMARRLSSSHGSGNGVRGQRSKRKKHHSLETRVMEEEEGEIELQSSEGNIKEVDDSWFSERHGKTSVDSMSDKVFQSGCKAWSKAPHHKQHSMMMQITDGHKSIDLGNSGTMHAYPKKFSRHEL